MKIISLCQLWPCITYTYIRTKAHNVLYTNISPLASIHINDRSRCVIMMIMYMWSFLVIFQKLFKWGRGIPLIALKQTVFGFVCYICIRIVWHDDELCLFTWSLTAFVFWQTAPSHILGQLDKVLREASTLDGVLEFRHEHFWTLSFGTLVRPHIWLQKS